MLAPTRRSFRIALITFAPLPALLLIALFAGWLALPASARAGGCNPPTTHPTIQAAIDDPTCTTINLDPIEYNENIVVDRSLSIVGAGAPEANGRLAPPTTEITGTLLVTPVIAISGPVAISITSVHIGGGGGEQGGGVLNNGGNILFDNVVIANNNTTQGGGGIHTNGGSVLLRNSVVRNNATSDPTGAQGNGGAIEAVSATLQITGTTISGNSASGNGGGIANISGTADIDFTVIIDNDAKGNGGGIYVVSGTLVIADTTVSGNIADNIGNPGGGDEQGGGIWNLNGTLVLARATVANNFASERGGGIYHNGGTLEIKDSTIQSNRAQNFGNPFGVNGGGLSIDTGDVVVSQTLIVSNEATFGAGVNSFFALTEIVNSTIQGNVADTGFGGGGGVNVDASTVFISQSLVVSNVAGNGGGIKAANFATFSLDDSTVQGNLAGGGGGLAIDTPNPTNLRRSVIANNSAFQDGGGLFLIGGSTLLQDSLVDNNDAGNNGGGFFTIGNALFIDGSTVANNSADDGAALYIDFGALLQMFNSTVSGNMPRNIDAAHMRLDVQIPSIIAASTVVDSDLEDNFLIDSVRELLELENTILDVEVATAGLELTGTIASGGNNIFGENVQFEIVTDGSDLIAIDPELSGLSLFGGGSQAPLVPGATAPGTGGVAFVHFPLPGSPAIDSGTCLFAGGTLTRDQVGTPRPQGAACDRGSVEFVMAPTAVTLTAVAAQPAAYNPLAAILLLTGLTWVVVGRQRRNN